MSAKAIGAALAVLLIASCSKPAVMEQFVKVSDADGGVYMFNMDFSDSLSVYDISFWSALTAASLRMASAVPVELDVEWIMPDDSIALKETVFLPFGKDGVAESEYRTDVMPEERGEWKLRVYVKNPPKGLRGLGTICTRKDGAR